MNSTRSHFDNLTCRLVLELLRQVVVQLSMIWSTSTLGEVLLLRCHHNHNLIITFHA